MLDQSKVVGCRGRNCFKFVRGLKAKRCPVVSRWRWPREEGSRLVVVGKMGGRLAIWPCLFGTLGHLRPVSPIAEAPNGEAFIHPRSMAPRFTCLVRRRFSCVDPSWWGSVALAGLLGSGPQLAGGVRRNVPLCQSGSRSRCASSGAARGLVGQVRASLG